MARMSLEWYSRHRNRVDAAVLAALLLVVLGQAYLLYRQRRLDRVAAEQSNQLLDTYMKGDTLKIQSAAAVSARLKNVRFKWSDRVYIDTDDMALRAEPVEGSAVNFDNPDAFVLAIQQSTVDVSVPVLEGMFNESVFNYPGSALRDLKVSVEPDHGDADDEGKGDHHGHDDDHGRETAVDASAPGPAAGAAASWLVQVKGSINVMVWIPFAMDAELSVDRASNALVIGVKKLKLLGFLPATGLIKLEPFHLDKFIPVPANGSLRIDQNRILVKPLGLFPPPRVRGQISAVRVTPGGVRIAFAGAPIAAPAANLPSNYVYLHGGTSEFGHIRMSDTDVLIADQDPRNRFVFSLADYPKLLPRCRVEVPNTNSVRVLMPDD